jgi:hypothetical protein
MVALAQASAYSFQPIYSNSLMKNAHFYGRNISRSMEKKKNWDQTYKI